MLCFGMDCPDHFWIKDPLRINQIPSAFSCFGHFGFGQVKSVLSIVISLQSLYITDYPLTYKDIVDIFIIDLRSYKKTSEVVHPLKDLI